MERGSITLYTCLVMGLLLCFTAAAIQSAAVSAGRVLLASALEQGVFSLFGEYDTELFERYGLLFLDAGRGKSTLQLQGLTDQTEEYASYILNPRKESMLPEQGLLKFHSQKASLLAYTLATDGGGAAFSEQACRAMKDALPSATAGILKDRVAEYLETSSHQVDQMNNSDMKNAQEVYEHARNADVEENAESRVKTDFSDEEIEAAKQIQLGNDYQDPVEAVSSAEKRGILALAVPPGVSVSAASVQIGDLPSHRTLQRGIGVIPAASETVTDRVLLNEYAMNFFSYFTNCSGENGLQYQVEYLIAGHSSDQENLKSVLVRLLAVREASNFSYLSANSVRRAETLAAANAVCSALLVPYLAPAVAVAVRAAWAYAESVADLRVLLSGGEIPLVKTDASWQLSVEKLPGFLKAAAAGVSEAAVAGMGDTSSGEKDGAAGLDYGQYLKILLAAKKTSQLISGFMDMVEHTMREAAGKPAFRMDCCVSAVNMELKADLDERELTAAQYYRYGEPV